MSDAPPRPSDAPSPAGDASPWGSCELSVVIAAYNRAHLIERAIASVRSQTLQPAEVIVVDDDSTDDTARVAAAAGARVIKHSQNLGPSAARNTGIGAATQPWIAVLDSDDEWLPHHLATLWPLRNGHDLVAAAVLTSSTRDGRPRISGWPGSRELLLTSPAQLVHPDTPMLSLVVLRRSAAQHVGGYDERLRFGEEVDLYARILEHGSGLVSPVVSSVCHNHPERTTVDPMAVHALKRSWLKRYSERPWGDPRLLERALSVIVWDELRLALARRSVRTCLASAGWLLGRPNRLRGLVGMWLWRHRARRGGRRAQAAAHLRPAS